MQRCVLALTGSGARGTCLGQCCLRLVKPRPRDESGRQQRRHPAEFGLRQLFGCSSFTEGSDSSINIAGFCDEKVEAKMKEAFALAATDQAAANKIWTEVDRMVTDAAPAAPLFTPKHIDFVSKRLGNFQFNAQFYWMVTQSWVQ